MGRLPEGRCRQILLIMFEAQGSGLIETSQGLWDACGVRRLETDGLLVRSELFDFDPAIGIRGGWPGVLRRTATPW